MKFTQSLKKNRQFRIVYRRGRSAADKYLVLYALPNGLDINRLGVSVSKKVGCAVVRNRVSRLIKESYRLREQHVKNGFDLVFIARRPAGDSSFHTIYDSVYGMLLHHKVIVGD